MKSKTIVAVDDDVSVQVFVAQVLKGEGYVVHTASTAKSALAAMIDAPPDLAILDVDMPEMNGLALLAAMREHEVLQKVPVIFLTVKDTVADETEGLRAGVVDYISKAVLTPERVDILRFRVRNFFALQENERLRGVLATIVSANHEINNPMTVVQGGTDLLQFQGWIVDDPEARSTVERMVRAIDQIRDVMQRITKLTRFEIKPYLAGIEMLDLGDEVQRGS